MRWKPRLLGIVVVLVCLSGAGATIRVGAYNCENHPNNAAQDAQFRTILHAIGNESVNGVAKRVDILVMSETHTGSADRLTDVLNGL